MSPQSSELPPPREGENFADIVRILRKAVKETQLEFATRFHRSRTSITNLEGDEKPTDAFMDELVRQFPEHEKRIRDAYAVSTAQKAKSAGKGKRTTIERHIDELTHGGQFTFARTALRRALKDTHDEQSRHWLYSRLATVSLALRRWPEVESALTSAIELATSAGLEDDEIDSRNRLATYHQRRTEFSAALAVLDDGLGRHANAAPLWLRKGYVHWYEQSYVSAYTSLTTAMAKGSPKLTVMFARGQVLAEWGNYDDALSDLEKYLAAPDRKKVNVGEIRHARAYVWGHTGRLPDAFAEFAEVEKMKPKSPWLHYRWGLCHMLANEKKQAADRLIRSLRCENPWLKPPRRDHALTMLRDYNVDADVPDWTPDNGY